MENSAKRKPFSSNVQQHHLLWEHAQQARHASAERREKFAQLLTEAALILAEATLLRREVYQRLESFTSLIWGREEQTMTARYASSGAVHPEETEKKRQSGDSVHRQAAAQRPGAEGRRRSAEEQRKKARREELGRMCRAKSQALREHFEQIRRHYLLVICAWCNKHIRWRYLKDASSAHTSHGICPQCAAHFSKDLGLDE